MLRIRYLIEEGMLNDYSLSNSDVADIMDYIEQSKHKLRELSLRTVIKMADLRVSFPDNWKSYASMTLMY